MHNLCEPYPVEISALHSKCSALQWGVLHCSILMEECDLEHSISLYQWGETNLCVNYSSLGGWQSGVKQTWCPTERVETAALWLRGAWTGEMMTVYKKSSFIHTCRSGGVSLAAQLVEHLSLKPALWLKQTQHQIHISFLLSFKKLFSLLLKFSSVDSSLLMFITHSQSTDLSSSFLCETSFYIFMAPKND